MTATVKAGRRTVEISRADKLLIPPGITKLKLAEYHERVGQTMLRHAGDRPLNYERYPDGIDGHRIFQQHASGHFPDWVRRIEVPKKGGTVEHVVASEPATFVYLANQACITLHAWPSRVDRLDRPDKMVFDLDPSVEDPAEMLRAARLIVDLLHELGLTAWVMTSGSRGYHLVVSLQRRADHDTVRRFARDVATPRGRPRAGAVHDRAAQGQAERTDPRRLPDRLRPHLGRAVLGPRPAERAGRHPAARERAHRARRRAPALERREPTGAARA